MEELLAYFHQLTKCTEWKEEKKSNQYLVWTPFDFKTASILLGTLACSVLKELGWLVVLSLKDKHCGCKFLQTLLSHRCWDQTSVGPMPSLPGLLVHHCAGGVVVSHFDSSVQMSPPPPPPAPLIPARVPLASHPWLEVWVLLVMVSLGPTGFCQFSWGHCWTSSDFGWEESWCVFHLPLWDPLADRCVYDPQLWPFLCSFSKELEQHIETPVCFEIFVCERPCWHSMTLCLAFYFLYIFWKHS